MGEAPGYPHVEQEQALVWRGGGRRFFTHEAALKNAAKAVVRNELRIMGEDSIPPEQFMAAAAQVRGQIERGETPEVDWDALPEAEAPRVDDPFDADIGGQI